MKRQKARGGRSSQIVGAFVAPLAAFVAILFLFSFVPARSKAYEYLGPGGGTKWDPGTATASIHGFTSPDGPRSPGGATWSLMTSGFDLDPSAAGLDPDHGPSTNKTVVVTDLGVPGFVTVAAYETLFNDMLNKWADVSGFTNLGQVTDSGFDAGHSSGTTGDIRIAAWELTTPGILAHNFAPGTSGGPGGNTIFGDMHIDVARTWVDDPADTAGDGAGSFDLGTVVLHELGHALGLDHTSVADSVMEAGYNGGRRVLGPDDIAGIQALYGGPEDIHFSVAPPPNLAEGLETTCPTCNPTNDVYTVGPAPGGAGHGTEAEIFESSMGGENFISISGALGIGPGPHPKGSVPGPAPPGAMGLGPGDDITGISNGTNGTGGMDGVLLFSVDPAASGVAGTDVDYSANISAAAPPFGGVTPANPGGGDPGAEAAGDIYASTVLPGTPFGAYPGITSPIVAHAGKNRLFADEVVMGLQAPATNGSSGVGPAEDDLDAMELDGYGIGGFFSISAASPIVGAGPDAHESGPVPTFYPPPTPPPAPPHMSGETISADDILRAPGGVAGIYAPGHLIGLVAGDDIDALVVSDVTCEGGQFAIPPAPCDPPPNGFLNIGADMALFSLAPGSPSLSAGGFSPADVFVTSFGSSFSLYASHADLGLLFTDNINALDIRIGVLPEQLGILIPEPSAIVLALLALAGFAFLSGRRRKRAA